MAKNRELAWQRFQKVVDPLILAAPRITWEQVDWRLMNYLTTKGDGSPWMNHLALLLAISLCHTRIDVDTASRRIRSFHCRWTTIFPAYGLTHFAEWNPEVHMPRYLSDPDLPDPFETRQEFVRTYTASTRSLQIYLHSLPESEQTLYQQWVIPSLPVGLSEQLRQGKALRAAQEQRRKVEADAVAPHFAKIRGESHLRWNELFRLRQKARDVATLVQAGTLSLPVSFSYEEPRRRRRLNFLLWDRPSFVLSHAHAYSKDTVRRAQHRREAYAPEQNHYFLEFVGADDLSREEVPPRDPDALLWFGDLLRYEVLGEQPHHGHTEMGSPRQEYLRTWGYGGDDEDRSTDPFSTDNPGLLVGSTGDGTSQFIKEAQKRTNGLVFLIEPLYAAATFGLASLEFFTTTGARITELLQISLSPDCLYTMQAEGTQRLLVRLVPKGTDEPAEYLVGPETRRDLERVSHLLKEHYGLQPGELLPRVPFHWSNNRAHDFTEPRPYLFQYNRRHLSHNTITACMRFLCHGMVFTDASGKLVLLKAHLLRHVFASHLRHVEKVPIDIVAKILHQKDVRVTAYYSAPQWQQVVATTDTLLDRFATHLGSIEDAFVRAPAELQRQLEEAKQKVGPLTRVPGGECTCYALCPLSFACTGCVYKVPDPSHREEIVEQRHWAFVRLEQVKRRSLGPEIVKMQALVKRCDTELEEMDLMEDYQRDETYDPKLSIHHGAERVETDPSLAPETLRGETSANATIGQSRRRSARQRATNGHD